MTRDEVIDLLKVITAYDRRTVGEADVLVWAEQARRGRWTRDAALEVVHAHYQRSRDMIAPADVHAVIRAGRRVELERAYVPGHCADPELHTRIEAFADSKAIEHAPSVALPPALPDRRSRVRSTDVLAAAMRRGERARATAARDALAEPAAADESQVS